MSANLKIQFRCSGVLEDGRRCNRRLFDFTELKGKLEIKCPRCGAFNYVSSGISGGDIEGKFVINS